MSVPFMFARLIIYTVDYNFMFFNLQVNSAWFLQMAEGSCNAYSSMYRYYYPRLLIFGQKFSKNVHLVDDCIQEVFIRIWINRSKLIHVKNICGYVFTSFKNLLIKDLQRSSFINADVVEGVSSIREGSIEPEINVREQQLEVGLIIESVCAKLTSRQKEIVRLKYYENRSYTEIALILRISRKATYKLMDRALQEMKLAVSGLHIMLPVR